MAALPESAGSLGRRANPQKGLGQMAVLNRGTTEKGQKQAEHLSALYARARAKKPMPVSAPLPLEKDEEEILARLKARRKAGAKNA